MNHHRPLTHSLGDKFQPRGLRPEVGIDLISDEPQLELVQTQTPGESRDKNNEAESTAAKNNHSAEENTMTTTNIESNESVRNPAASKPDFGLIGGAITHSIDQVRAIVDESSKRQRQKEGTIAIAAAGGMLVGGGAGAALAVFVPTTKLSTGEVLGAAALGAGAGAVLGATSAVVAMNRMK